MIIWLNGAFGAGKTTIAHELQQKLPNAIFYDPEIIGSALMELVPEEMKENDFQEYQEWRSECSFIKTNVQRVWTDDYCSNDPL